MIDNRLKKSLKLLTASLILTISLFEANTVKAATVEKKNLSSRQKPTKIKLKSPQKQHDRANLLVKKVLLKQKSDEIAASSNLKELSAPQTEQLIPVPQQFQLAQVASGKASWYGPKFHGRPTASGEKFNQNAMTAAHRHLPFGTRVKVTNMNNGRSVVVRINDRGPFIGGRIIDLSAAAARTLGLIQSGVAPVSLQILGR